MRGGGSEIAVLGDGDHPARSWSIDPGKESDFNSKFIWKPLGGFK